MHWGKCLQPRGLPLGNIQECIVYTSFWNDSWRVGIGSGGVAV